MPDVHCGPWIDVEKLCGPDKIQGKKLENEAVTLAKTKESAVQRFKVLKVWHAWGVAWGLLNAPLDSTDVSSTLSTTELREERAKDLERVLSVFVGFHIAAVGTTEGLYLHMLHAHAPDQVRLFGDLRVRQTQGLEHAHKIRKQIGLLGTNRKQGQRLATMLCHKQVGSWPHYHAGMAPTTSE